MKATKSSPRRCKKTPARRRYPPFSRIISIYLKHRNDAVVDHAARHLAALLRPHRDRLLRQGRLYLANGAAAREECRQAVLPDTDPRKLRRLGERLIAQELGPLFYNAGIEEAIRTHLAWSERIQEEMDLKKVY